MTSRESWRGGVRARLRRWCWFERGAGFAEAGVWKHKPAAYIRAYGVAAVYAAVLFVVLSVMTGQPTRSLSNVTVFLLSLLPLIIPAVIVGSRTRRVDRAMKLDVIEARGLVCPGCLYDLRGSAGADRCPECGLVVEMETLPRRWARCVRELRYGDGERAAVTGWWEV